MSPEKELRTAFLVRQPLYEPFFYFSLLFFRIILLCFEEYTQYLEDNFEHLPAFIEDVFTAFAKKGFHVIFLLPYGLPDL